MLGFLEHRGLSPGDHERAAQVYAKLCPGISGVGLRVQPDMSVQASPRKPRENTSVWEGSKPDQAPLQPPHSGPQAQTHVKPRTQERKRLGIHSLTGDVRHLLCKCQHVLAVQPLTRLWKQVCICSACAAKQGCLACG